MYLGPITSLFADPWASWKPQKFKLTPIWIKRHESVTKTHKYAIIWVS